MWSRRSSTVQWASLVDGAIDKEDDAECPGLRALPVKLNEPASIPCERFSIKRPICAGEL